MSKCPRVVEITEDLNINYPMKEWSYEEVEPIYEYTTEPSVSYALQELSERVVAYKRAYGECRPSFVEKMYGTFNLELVKASTDRPIKEYSSGLSEEEFQRELAHTSSGQTDNEMNTNKKNSIKRGINRHGIKY